MAARIDSRGGFQWQRTAIILALLANAVPAATLSGFELSGDLTVASDCIFRGASQTMSSLAVHGTVSIDHESGAFAYVWASNVDYTAAGEPDDGVRSEVDFVVGYSHEFSQDVEVSLSWAKYVFPTTNPDTDYDYDEWIGSLVLADRHWMEIGYSDSVFASDEKGTYYAIGTGVGVPGDLWLDIGVGHYDLDAAYSASYQFAEASLSGQLKTYDWRIAYVITHGAEELFHQSTIRPRLVAEIGFSF